MQIAEVLSDLTSLRVCDHSAALALVSVHKGSNTSASTNQPEAMNSGTEAHMDDDVDMKRVMDLVGLHYGVKMNYMQGEDAGLRKARTDVERVLEKLESKETDSSRNGG